MSSQKDDFSLANYKRCLEKSLENNYTFHTLDNFFEKRINSEKSIIMRHDVDTQLDVALKMAEIESELNIKSTYFIRIHSHSYNLFCIKDYQKIKKIHTLGHEIGLHYESDFYGILKKDVVESIIKEKEMLEYFLDVDIKTVCPHEPTRTNCFHVENLKLNQAYDKSIFKKYKYISDSSCRWRDGSFLENIKNNIENIYILTHPYWWYENSPIENY